MSVVETKVTPPVGTVVLNRPDSANAIDRSMVAELRQSLSDLHQEKRVRAAIFTGAGDTFCSGSDLSELAAAMKTAQQPGGDLHAQWGAWANELAELLREMLEFPKPIIAAVNGPVAGIGVALLMASDMSIACDMAELSVPDAQVGMVAGLVVPLLAYRCGPSLAARLGVVGQKLDAAAAHRLGIYHELVPHDLLWARAMELGTLAAAGAPQAISLTKRLLLETAGEKLLTDLTSGAIAMATSLTTPAAEEGLQAYTEQREPQWD